MYNNYGAMSHGAMFGSFFGIPGGLGFGLALLLLWSLAWKGWALWLAARRDENVWFIVLLIVNTAGILDIIYIFAIAKRKDVKEPRVTVLPPGTPPSKPQQ